MRTDLWFPRSPEGHILPVTHFSEAAPAAVFLLPLFIDCYVINYLKPGVFEMITIRYLRVSAGSGIWEWCRDKGLEWSRP